MRDTCSDCGASLTDADLREGPEHPEVGYVYYKCPDCGHLMPGPTDASPNDGPSYLPGDPDWRENPREFHDQMNLNEAVLALIRDEAPDEGISRDRLASVANDHYALTADETHDIAEDLLMSGRCYEPDDDLLKAL
jgi:hypothetical protein